MPRVDLNCDMGESFGLYKIGLDEKVVDVITSANIACGAHAGDPIVMRRTVRLCRRAGVMVGAHPGFPDLQGFGRRDLIMTPEEVRDYMVWQIGALLAFCRAEGVEMQHVKPHGALYNMAARDPRLARAIAEAVREVDPSLILVGLAGSELIKAGEELGLRVAGEAFADRGYCADGSLVPRFERGAIIKDPEVVAARVMEMVTEGFVTAVDGTRVPIKAHTICIHGDTPGAVELAKAVKARLEDKGLEIAPMKHVVG